MDTTRDLEEAFENELELTLVVPDAEDRAARIERDFWRQNTTQGDLDRAWRVPS